MWGKIYKKIFHERKKESSTRLDDSVIVIPWSKNNGHHHIKDPWAFSKLGYGEIKSISPHHGLLTEEWGHLASRDRTETTVTKLIRTINPRNM